MRSPPRARSSLLPLSSAGKPLAVPATGRVGLCTAAARAGINVRAWTRDCSPAAGLGRPGGSVPVERCCSERGVFPGSSLTRRAFTCCNRQEIRYSHRLFLLTPSHAFKSYTHIFTIIVLLSLRRGSLARTRVNLDQQSLYQMFYLLLLFISVINYVTHSWAPSVRSRARAATAAAALRLHNPPA